MAATSMRTRRSRAAPSTWATGFRRWRAIWRTLNVRAFKPRIGTLSLQSRLSGRQFDDDANAIMLHGYLPARCVRLARLRLATWNSSPPARTCSTATIEVAKTPTTTLGMRRVARAGVNLKLGPAR